MDQKLLIKDRGYSLVELIIGSGLLILALDASLRFYFATIQIKDKTEVIKELVQLRTDLIEFTGKSDDLLESIVNTSGNSSIKCSYKPDTTCEVQKRNLKINGTASSVLNTIGSSSHGLTKEIRPCLLSDPTCVYKLSMNWEPVCPLGATECNPRYVYVQVDVHRRDVSSILAPAVPTANEFVEDVRFGHKKLVAVSLADGIPLPPPPSPPPAATPPANITNEDEKVTEEFQQLWNYYCQSGDVDRAKVNWQEYPGPLNAPPGSPNLTLDGPSSPDIPYTNITNLTAKNLSRLEAYSVDFLDLTNVERLYTVAQEITSISGTASALVKAAKIGDINDGNNLVIESLGIVGNISNVNQLYGKFARVGEISDSNNINIEVSQSGPSQVSSVSNLFLRGGTQIDTLDLGANSHSCVDVRAINSLTASDANNVIVKMTSGTISTVTLLGMNGAFFSAPRIQTLNAQSINNFKLFGTASQLLQMDSLSLTSQNHTFVTRAHITQLNATSINSVVLEDTTVDHLIADGTQVRVRFIGASKVNRITVLDSETIVRIVRDAPYDSTYHDVDKVVGPVNILYIEGAHVREVENFTGTSPTFSNDGTIDIMTP